MKNLNNEENSDFEKSWKDAFEGAELEPSEDVWLKIDGVLANQEAKGFKRTIVYYKYAAAVSLLLLLSTAVLSYYLLNGNEDSTQQVANNNSHNIESVEKAGSSNSSITKNRKENTENYKIEESTQIADNKVLKNDAVEKLESDKSLIIQNNKGIKENYQPKDSETSGFIAKNRSSNNDVGNKLKENVNEDISNEEDSGIKNQKNLAELNNINEAENTSKNEAEKTWKYNDNINTKKVLKHEEQNLISKNEADANKAFNSVNQNNEEQITRGLTSYVAPTAITPQSHKTLALTRKKLQNEIYRVPVVQNKKDKKDEDTSSKGYFAGLQISPGYFDPNIQMNSNGLFAANSFFDSDRSVKLSTLASQNYDVEAQPQVSYTYGLNFGFKVARRWLINMGLQYSKNHTSGTTSYVFDENTRYLATPTTLNNLSNDAADYTESLNYSLPIMGYQPYLEVYEFTSLPVKAGYVIVDKKLTWIVSTGIATDFFLQSRSHDPSGKSDDQLVKSGESTNFKKVFFNGLGSSEVIYNINKHYSISLEPSFRAAISSFSKTDSQFSSHPKTFGIAAGFRYNF